MEGVVADRAVRSLKSPFFKKSPAVGSKSGHWADIKEADWPGGKSGL